IDDEFQDESAKSRYADTSLTIHQQLGEKQVRTFPSVANILEETAQKVNADHCQTVLRVNQTVTTVRGESARKSTDERTTVVLNVSDA
ncbi:hypothetical protein RUM43_008940, partial [Polyplax serrata]